MHFPPKSKLKQVCFPLQNLFEQTHHSSILMYLEITGYSVYTVLKIVCQWKFCL